MRKICQLFTVCTKQMRSLFTENAASGLPNPTHSSFTFNISYEMIENIHVELKNFTFRIQIGNRRQNDKDAQKISLIQPVPDKNY